MRILRIFPLVYGISLGLTLVLGFHFGSAYAIGWKKKITSTEISAKMAQKQAELAKKQKSPKVQQAITATESAKSKLQTQTSAQPNSPKKEEAAAPAAKVEATVQTQKVEAQNQKEQIQQQVTQQPKDLLKGRF